MVFLPRKARNRVSPDAETITKRDLRANQSYLRHFPSGRKVIGETRRENFVNHFPDQKLSVFSVVNILIRVEEDCPRAREDCPQHTRTVPVLGRNVPVQGRTVPVQGRTVPAWQNR